MGSCCETHRLATVRVVEHSGACLIGGESFVTEVAEGLTVARERFTVVPGAVDTTRFQPTGQPVSAHAGEPARLFYHGRVDR